MKKILLITGAAVLVLAGCTALQSRTSYNTLATIGNSANSAYAAYESLVVTRQVATNSVPQVARAYNEFQAGFGAAVAAAQFNLTNIPPQNVLDLYSNLVRLINYAEGK